MKRTTAIILLLILVCWPMEETDAREGGLSKDGAFQQLDRAFEEARATGRTAIDIVIQEEEQPDVVQAGDLVRVVYTAKTEEGQIIHTIWSQASHSSGNAATAAGQAAVVSSPEELAAGRPGEFPGIGEAILGMKAGEKSRKIIPPQRAFGAHEQGKMQSFPCERRVPRVLAVSVAEYVKSMNVFPVAGKEVALAPYFNSRVVEVGESTVTIENIARDGERHEDPIGVTEIRLTEDEIILTLRPRIGAPFEAQGKQGRITSADGRSFTVDFNHPLAGKAVTLDIEVLSLVKSSQIGSISWIEDYNQAVEAAAVKGRPLFLLLYAEWCGWCKKMISESMTDARMRMLKDRFIWARIDSDKAREYAEAFDQKDFPLVVVLNPKGEVVKKIDGYRDAAALKRELDGL